MDEKELLEKIDVIKAYIDGYTIQAKGVSEGWDTVVGEPPWSFGDLDYRVAPTPPQNPTKRSKMILEVMQMALEGGAVYRAEKMPTHTYYRDRNPVWDWSDYDYLVFRDNGWYGSLLPGDTVYVNMYGLIYAGNQTWKPDMASFQE